MNPVINITIAYAVTTLLACIAMLSNDMATSLGCSGIWGALLWYLNRKIRTIQVDDSGIPRTPFDYKYILYAIAGIFVIACCISVLHPSTSQSTTLVSSMVGNSNDPDDVMAGMKPQLDGMADTGNKIFTIINIIVFGISEMMVLRKLLPLIDLYNDIERLTSQIKIRMGRDLKVRKQGLIGQLVVHKGDLVRIQHRMRGLSYDVVIKNSSGSIEISTHDSITGLRELSSVI